MPKILLLTDLHLVPPGQMLFDSDPEARLRAALRDIARDHADAACMVISGDLAHRGEPAAYQRLAAVLAEEAVVPWRLTLGNHDDRVAFCGVFQDHPLDAAGFVQSVVDLAEVRLVIADTAETGEDGGRLCEARLGWLSQALREAGDRPVHLFLHHPPVPIGLPIADGIRLADDDALLAVIRASGACIAQLYFGHVHRPVAGSWHGMPLAMLRSLNHQAPLALGRAAPLRTGPAEYAIILIEGPTTIIHFHDYLSTHAEVTRVAPVPTAAPDPERTQP